MCQGYVAFCGEQLSLHPLFFFLMHFSHSMANIAHLDKSLCCDIPSLGMRGCLFQSNSLGEFIELPPPCLLRKLMKWMSCGTC